MFLKNIIVIFFIFKTMLFASEFTVNPKSGYVGDNFDFKLIVVKSDKDYDFYLNFNRTDDENQWLELYNAGGKVKMDCYIYNGNFNCYKSKIINGIGNRRARIAVFEGDRFLGYSSSYVSFLVKEKTKNNIPILKTEQSPPSKVNIGEYVTLKLSAYDNDGNLQQIDVDWEGSGKICRCKHVYIMRLLYFSRKFTKEGTYTITGYCL